MSTRFSPASLSRRDWMRLSAAGALGISASTWLPALAANAAADSDRKRACILLWMSGGPSQLDTFDPKPGQNNGGEFRPIGTSVPGILVAEHLPQLAKQMQHVVPIRSVTSREGDHSRATYAVRTGYRQQGGVRFPALGSVVGKELSSEENTLPDYVSVGPNRALNPQAYASGFLGPKFAPLVVGTRYTRNGEAFDERNLQVPNLDLPANVSAAEAAARLDLLREVETRFDAEHPGPVATSHRTAYEQAVRTMQSKASKAFELSDEPDALRDAYGRNQFGQGCLLARRLIETGVPFVEVSLNGVDGNQSLGWDTHRDNFRSVERLCNVLDPAWATLISDLKDRGMLDSTLIVWMGEFGRTPVINQNGGRDHYPDAWSAVLAGGGIQGGQTIGRTSRDGLEVVDRPITIPDVLATICRALGLDPMKQNMSNVGRPIRLADPSAQPIEEVLS